MPNSSLRTILFACIFPILLKQTSFLLYLHDEDWGNIRTLYWMLSQFNRNNISTQKMFLLCRKTENKALIQISHHYWPFKSEDWFGIYLTGWLTDEKQLTSRSELPLLKSSNMFMLLLSKILFVVGKFNFYFNFSKD